VKNAFDISIFPLSVCCDVSPGRRRDAEQILIGPAHGEP
jgi:hypothetical protein